MILGDPKQLPNVVVEKDARYANEVFKELNLPEGYRFINNRLFFVCGETLEDVLINLEIVAGTLNAMDYEKISDEFTILEIDVNGYNVDFYQDGYYNDDVKYIGYCYTYFPPKRIRIVDKEELYG